MGTPDTSNKLAAAVRGVAVAAVIVAVIYAAAPKSDAPQAPVAPTTDTVVPFVPSDLADSVAASPTVPAVASENEPEPFVPTAEDIDMAVDVLTRPDNRDTVNGTYRWAGPTLTYRINLPGFDPAYLAEVTAAIAFTEKATGIDWVQVQDNPQLDIIAGTDNGGLAQARPDASGVIRSATVTLGCCRTRVAWEEITQVMGAFGDHTDARSVFSNDHSRTRAGSWETWALHALYSVPAGSDVDTIRRALAG